MGFKCSPVGKQAWTFILTVLPTQIHIVRGIPLYKRGIPLTPLLLWLVERRQVPSLFPFKFHLRILNKVNKFSGAKWVYLLLNYLCSTLLINQKTNRTSASECYSWLTLLAHPTLLIGYNVEVSTYNLRRTTSCYIIFEIIILRLIFKDLL